jgi:hypothetical protein
MTGDGQQAEQAGEDKKYADDLSNLALCQVRPSRSL